MDESTILIAGWIITGVVAVIAIALTAYQMKTGKKWSDRKTARVVEALKGVASAVVKAIQDGKITQDELRVILEATVHVLAEVIREDPDTAAAEIPGAAEQIRLLNDLTAPIDNSPVTIEQK